MKIITPFQTRLIACGLLRCGKSFCLLSITDIINKLRISTVVGIRAVDPENGSQDLTDLDAVNWPIAKEFWLLK